MIPLSELLTESPAWRDLVRHLNELTDRVHVLESCLQLSSSPNDVKLLGMLTDAMSDLREAHEELEFTQLDLVECQQQRDDLHRQLLEERDGFRATLRRYGIWVAG